jgi:K+-sensing histidine kinase KdpD
LTKTCGNLGRFSHFCSRIRILGQPPNHCVYRLTPCGLLFISETIMTIHIVLQELDSGINHKIDLPCVVGRGHEANLRFSNCSVSHRHALIVEMNNQIWIEDLNSANGVYVNDEKITEKSRLNPGDSLQLGETKLLVTQEEEDFSQQTLVLHSLDPKAGWKLDREKLKLISEITNELSENQDVKALGEKIFSRLKDIFKQDRSYLALFQEDGTLNPILVDPVSESVPLSRSIVNRLFQNGESLLLEDALSEASFKEQESIIALRIRSALCVPLIYHSQIYGLIYLDRNITGAYKQDDLEFLRTIAFMLAPLIENARLWSELKNRYTSAMDTLRETQARLIDMERASAYVRLAQAMAHEIRNPLMAIGGLMKRIVRSRSENQDNSKLRMIMTLVERAEAVLKEVDYFVEIPPPQKKLARVDHVVQEVIDSHNWESLKNGQPPSLDVNTPHLMIPLDPDLLKKAISMIFKEVLLSIPQQSEFRIVIQHAGNDLDILIGEINRDSHFCEVFDPALKDKPWSLGLFLNIAHKIVSDHGGKLLLDPQGHAPFPVLIRLPRTINL